MSPQVGQCLQNVYLMSQKCDYCIRTDCIKMWCKKLKNSAMEIINYEKKRNDTIN